RASEYDDLIRRLVPAYTAMRTVQVDLLALFITATGGRALDLGGGPGARGAWCPARARGEWGRVGSPVPATGGRVLDLGGGTGALAAAIAERFPAAEGEIWDTDSEMLATARERCAAFGGRVLYVERSFMEPLPPCDAVAACIALHHVKDM